MSSNFRSPDAEYTAPDGTGRRVAIAVGRFNDHITRRLLVGARATLVERGVAEADIDEAWVPGAFELPLAAKTLAATGRYDAVITIGCVIRGDTAHFEYVAGPCAEGVMQAQLETGVPIIFGVLTTENLEQALVRSVPLDGSEEGDNKGSEAADTALEMAELVTWAGTR